MADIILSKVYDPDENALRTTGGGDAGGGDTTYTAPASGELAGSTTAAQCPDVACSMVMFTALSSNVGKVYIGAAGVTVPNGTTDTTSGIELAPGAATPWIPVDNLNRLYRISDNAGDDLTYLALA